MKKYPVYGIHNFEQNVFYNNLYVNSFKDHFKNHHFIEELHRHDFYLLVLFTNGSGSHTIDFDTFEIKKGSLFLMQPGQIHSWSLSNDIDGYIMFFSKEIFNLHFKSKQIEHYSFFQLFENKPFFLLPSNNFEKAILYFNIMLEESKQDNFYKKDELLNLLDLLLIEISSFSSSKTQHQQPIYNYKLKQFELCLEAYYKTEKAPSYYSEELSITLKHLNRITKSILNKTVTELITQRVLLEGKRLLVERKLNVMQIADELGFSSANYFIKLFKKKEGITTKDFLKKVSG
jgi:AraC-like DNA-binding protein